LMKWLVGQEWGHAVETVEGVDVGVTWNHISANEGGGGENGSGENRGRRVVLSFQLGSEKENVGPRFGAAAQRWTLTLHLAVQVGSRKLVKKRSEVTYVFAASSLLEGRLEMYGGAFSKKIRGRR